MVTEISRLPLWKGQSLYQPSSRTFTLLKDTLNTLTQQPGFQHAYWGTQHENPSMLQLAVDWGSLNDHIQFTASSDYKVFFDKIGQIADTTKVVTYHAHLFPHPPLQAISMPNSPVTETVIIYFPRDYPQTDQEKFDSDIRELAATIQKHSPDIYTGFAGGWVTEELPFLNDGSQERCKAYAGFSGWRSVQDHLDFAGTQIFQDSFQLLRGAKDWKGLTVCHISSRRIDKDAGET